MVFNASLIGGSGQNQGHHRKDYFDGLYLIFLEGVWEVARVNCFLCKQLGYDFEPQESVQKELV